MLSKTKLEVNEECTLKAKVMGYKHCVLVNKAVSHCVHAKSVNNSEIIIHETTQTGVLKLNN